MNVVNYIIDGKEKKLGYTRFQLFDQSKIMTMKELVTSLEISIHENVEFLHIKRVNFSKNVKIICENNQTEILLDQCGFEGSNFKFDNGCFHIIAPQFSQNTISLTANVNELQLELSANNTNHITALINANNVGLYHIGNYSDIALEAKQAFLKNMDNIFSLYFTGHHLTIEDSNSHINLYCMVTADQMCLQNTTLASKSLTLECNQLQLGENVCLHSSNDIELNKILYHKHQLTANDIQYLHQKSQLISILKGLKIQINEVINKDQQIFYREAEREKQKIMESYHRQIQRIDNVADAKAKKNQEYLNRQAVKQYILKK